MEIILIFTQHNTANFRNDDRFPGEDLPNQTRTA